MIPQLDSSVYFSQLFWLFISLSILTVLFKKRFIPRMNLVIDKRDKHIHNCNIEIKNLKDNIKTLHENIENTQKKSTKQSAEIISTAIKKSSDIFNNQIKIIKQENEELINGTRKRQEEEIKNLDSAFKIQIDITAQSIFSKLFERRI
jgi:F0F1-type ATP synthase membrane subunit b/b'